MFTVGNINFTEWFREELSRRGISQAEIARLSGLSPAQISRIYNGLSFPSEDGYKAIAHALGIPAEIVFRAAGLLPPETELTPLLKELIDVVSQLPPDVQVLILKTAKLHQEQVTPQKTKKKTSRSKPRLEMR